MKRSTFNLCFAAVATIGIPVLLAACGTPSGGGDKVTDVVATTDTVTAEELSLELPNVPVAISAPHEKAGFIAIHFWDNLDFTDSSKALNVDFMEQNFVDYLSIMPAVMATDRLKAFGALIEQASATPETLALILALGEKYLNHPDSPMLNSEYYSDFVKVANAGSPNS